MSEDYADAFRWNHIGSFRDVNERLWESRELLFFEGE